MWLLKSNDEKVIYIKPNTTFTVGRKKGNLILSDDSISRHHAEITVTAKKDISEIMDSKDPLSTCMIKDPGSKYGNFILKAGRPAMQVPTDGYIFEHMDKIRFGVQTSTFTVMYVPIITATSGLDETKKDELKDILDRIDGVVAHRWDTTCTHMTISPSKIISEKLTCSLAFGIPLVPMEYWKCVLKAFEANEEFPHPNDFAKLLTNRMGMLSHVDITPNPLRRTLFKNLTFIHFDSRKYALHSRIIKLAGGESLLYKHRLHQDLDVCADNVIVVQLVESSTTQATGSGDAHYAAICERLGKCRRRTIPESEIALAVLHSSIEKCCNPKHDHAGMFKTRKANNLPMVGSSVLAQDTQDVDLPMVLHPGESRLTDKKAKSGGSVKNAYIQESTELDSQIAEMSLEKPPRIVGKDYIRESSSEYSCVDSQPVLIASSQSSCSLANSASSSLNEFANPARTVVKPSLQNSSSKSHDNIKVASLNQESCLDDEYHGKSSVNSLKRIREDDEMTDGAKKICRDESVDTLRIEKQSAVKEIPPKYIDDMSGNDDIVFKDSKIVTTEDLFKVNRGRPDSERVHKLGENDNSGKKEFVSMASFSGSIEKTDNYASEDQILGKRKLGKSKGSMFWDDHECKTKRNKIMTTCEKKNSKVTEVETARQRTPLKTEWIWIQKSETDMQDPGDSFISMKNYSRDKERITSFGSGHSKAPENLKEAGDSNTTLQPLLRIESSTDVKIPAQKNFGKCFRKTYKLAPRRIDMDDMVDMNSWHETLKVPKKNVSSDEERSMPHKSSLSKTKQSFRV